jgi:hypothetical protein
MCPTICLNHGNITSSLKHHLQFWEMRKSEWQKILRVGWVWNDIHFALDRNLCSETVEWTGESYGEETISVMPF